MGFEDQAALKEHMTTKHHSSIIFIEKPLEVRQKTLAFHRDFYDSTGIYKEEVAYKLCKCTNLPTQTTRKDLYLHSIEASHYPLIQCQKCKVLMEREDVQEHAEANCDPVVEGGFFLEAMNKQQLKLKMASDAKKKKRQQDLSANFPASPQVENSDLSNFWKDRFNWMKKFKRSIDRSD